MTGEESETAPPTAAQFSLLIGLPSAIGHATIAILLFLPATSSLFIQAAALTLGCCGLCLLLPVLSAGAIITGSVALKTDTIRALTGMSLGVVGIGLLIAEILFYF